MAKFKIGDRVRMVEHHEDSKPIAIGWLGTVVAFSGVHVGVSWDVFAEGHNCSIDMEELGRPKHSGRWMCEECLAKVNVEAKPTPRPASKPKPTFKVGDKVIIVRHKSDSDRVPLHTTGRVVKVHSESWLGVCFDDFTDGHDVNHTLTGAEAKSGWNVSPECLEMLVESEAAELAAELVEIGEAIVAGLVSSLKPKTQTAETSSELKPCCANCQEWYPMEGCEHGFCNSWHNFCTKNEFCSRIKMCG